MWRDLAALYRLLVGYQSLSREDILAVLAERAAELELAREFRGTVHFECRVAGIARALEDAEAKAAKASAG